jgi:hypothetical protein
VASHRCRNDGRFPASLADGLVMITNIEKSAMGQFEMGLSMGLPAQ